MFKLLSILNSIKKNRIEAGLLLIRVRIAQFFTKIIHRHSHDKRHISINIPPENEPIALEALQIEPKQEELSLKQVHTTEIYSFDNQSIEGSFTEENLINHSFTAPSYEIKTVYPIIMPEEAPNIFKPGELTVDELNEDLEPFGFAYYPHDDIFYSIMDGWQRDCGYCQLYDEACATLSMIIDCEPIYFEYGGKRWLIEFWKGQYGMNTGAEIGVYTTTGPDLNIPGVFNGTFYDCASNEDHLVLGFRLKKFGKILVARRQLHWWITCFLLGEFSHPGNLIMDCEVTFKNPEMRDAFLGGMYRAGYNKSQLTIQGNTVSFVYDKPKARQPLARNAITEFIMQTNNHRNCRAYNDATIGYTNHLDKINFIKKQAPKIYKKILNIRSSKEIFKLFDLLKDYLELPERPIDTYGGIAADSTYEQIKSSHPELIERHKLEAEESFLSVSDDVIEEFKETDKN
jgi:hypothetical protein